LTQAVGAASGIKGANDAFGGSGSQAHQRAGRFAGIPYRDAGFGRLIATPDPGLDRAAAARLAQLNRQSGADSSPKYGNVLRKSEGDHD
jgi:hypothetical protein